MRSLSDSYLDQTSSGSILGCKSLAFLSGLSSQSSGVGKGQRSDSLAWVYMWALLLTAV